MEILQRGIPPYTVFSADLTDIKGHHCSADTFLKALEIFFELTYDDVPDQRDPNYIVQDSRIIDSNGNVIFSADNETDHDLLRQIDELEEGFAEVKIVKPAPQK